MLEIATIGPAYQRRPTCFWLQNIIHCLHTEKTLLSGIGDTQPSMCKLLRFFHLLIYSFCKFPDDTNWYLLKLFSFCFCLLFVIHQTLYWFFNELFYFICMIFLRDEIGITIFRWENWSSEYLLLSSTLNCGVIGTYQYSCLLPN